MSKVKGLENIAKFQSFCQERDEKQDWQDFIAADGTQLNRTQVASAAMLASRKVLVGVNANPTVARMLEEAENLLRGKGILLPAIDDTHKRGLGIVEIFLAWKASVSNEDLAVMIANGEIKRGEVAKVIGCGPAAFNQNSALRTEYENFIDELRDSGLLPQLTTKEKAVTGSLVQYDQGAIKRDLNAQRVGNLEQENIELRAKIAELESKLERYVEISVAMAELGFFPQ